MDEPREDRTGTNCFALSCPVFFFFYFAVGLSETGWRAEAAAASRDRESTHYFICPFVFAEQISAVPRLYRIAF